MALYILLLKQVFGTALSTQKNSSQATFPVSIMQLNWLLSDKLVILFLHRRVQFTAAIYNAPTRKRTLLTIN
jgi:hypothetical protein